MTYKSKTIEEILHLASQAGVAVVLFDPSVPTKTFVQNENVTGVGMDVSNDGKKTVVVATYTDIRVDV
jgi:hypothetical protein